MTPREQAAFNAGIETMRQMAMIAAVSLETREGGGDLQHRAAAAALHGLAEGAAGLVLGAEGTHETRTPKLGSALAAIAADPADSGTVDCPVCKGRLAWAWDSYNGHLHAECETPGCFRLMQ